MARTSAFVALIIGPIFAATAGTPPDNALWSADRTVAVTASPDASRTRVTAFLRRQNGTFLEVDLSAVEDGNFGKLGRRRTEYDRFETKPIAWLPRRDGLLQVNIQTRAWRAGRRYTVSEPLILRRNGTAIWR